MFSGFSALFDRAFIVGFLLPTLVGLVLAAQLFPGIELLDPLRDPQVAQDTLDKAAYVLLVAYVVAVALAMANTFIYGVLCGYLPPLSKIDWLTRRHEKIRKALRTRRRALQLRWSRQQGAGLARSRSETAQRIGELSLRLVQELPPPGIGVQPTRLGNVIKAFETYPYMNYGVDGPPMWLRLGAVTPKEFATEVANARSEVNCLVNLCVIAGGLGACALILAIGQTPWPRLVAAAGHWTGWSVDPRVFLTPLAFLVAYAFYVAAVNRAKAWGDLVRAAFDCYLPALVKQLGYVLPTTADERRAFFGDLNRLIIYEQPPQQPDRWPMLDVKPPTPPGPSPFRRRLREARD